MPDKDTRDSNTKRKHLVTYKRPCLLPKVNLKRLLSTLPSTKKISDSIKESEDKKMKLGDNKDYCMIKAKMRMKKAMKSCYMPKISEDLNVEIGTPDEVDLDEAREILKNKKIKIVEAKEFLEKKIDEVWQKFKINLEEIFKINNRESTAFRSLKKYGELLKAQETQYWEIYKSFSIMETGIEYSWNFLCRGQDL